MIVLIAGANGMVARAAAKYCRDQGDEVHALTRAEMDITDLDAVNRTVIAIAPEAIFNCAAYTNVDGAEKDRDSCFAVNSVGVENLAKAASEVGSKFVTISTDYVFDGKKDGFYFEDDEPHPLAVYAESKLRGEQLAAAADPRSVIVRSGWIFGPGGTNFLSIMNDLLRGGRAMTAISDSSGTPTYAVDLAARMRELALLDAAGIIHVSNSGSGTSYFGFAEMVCDLGGYDKQLVSPISDSSLKRPASRPLNSKLASRRSASFGLEPLPDWKDALDRFIRSESKKADTT